MFGQIEKFGGDVRKVMSGKRSYIVVIRGKYMENTHKFYEKHSSEISWDTYLEIIKKIEGTIDGKCYRESWDFEETEDSMIFNAEISYWVYHDESIYKYCNVRFTKENDICDEIEWITDNQRITRMGIPCEGLHVLDSSSYHNGDNWSYAKGDESVYLLLEPYGLKGIWKYFIKRGEYRK